MGPLAVPKKLSQQNDQQQARTLETASPSPAPGPPPPAQYIPTAPIAPQWRVSSQEEEGFGPWSCKVCQFMEFVSIQNRIWVLCSNAIRWLNHLLLRAVISSWIQTIAYSTAIAITPPFQQPRWLEDSQRASGTKPPIRSQDLIITATGREPLIIIKSWKCAWFRQLFCILKHWI